MATFSVFSAAGDVLRRFDDALDTLQVLKERGYRIGLISNQPAGTTVAQIVTLLDKGVRTSRRYSGRQETNRLAH